MDKIIALLVGLLFKFTKLMVFIFELSLLVTQLNFATPIKTEVGPAGG